jgi:F-type H+-transporting ATPase subunit gamma
VKTLEDLRRRINSIRDLQSVVSTMKSLAAARIRQFETAAAATRTCQETVDLALQILLRQHPAASGNQLTTSALPGCLIVLGSDQGFCGRFNEIVFEAAARRFPAGSTATAAGSIRAVTPDVLTIGLRVNQLAVARGWPVRESLPVPGSVAEITGCITQILMQMDEWLQHRGLPQIDVVYNRRKSAASYLPRHLQLLPLPDSVLDRLRQQTWESRSLPVYQLPRSQVFSCVLRHYLFIQLFRACAESLASENASRIAAMQVAEKNIESRLDELNRQFNRDRQQAITEELRDIMSGFEAVRQEQRTPAADDGDDASAW